MGADLPKYSLAAILMAALSACTLRGGPPPCHAAQGRRQALFQTQVSPIGQCPDPDAVPPKQDEQREATANRPLIQPDAQCRWHAKGEGPPVECRYQCEGTLTVVKLSLPTGMVRCPGEGGMNLRWSQIHGVVTDPASSPSVSKVPAALSQPLRDAHGDDQECINTGSGGVSGFPNKFVTCTYNCGGTEHVIVLPSGVVRCPGADSPSVKWKEIKGFRRVRLFLDDGCQRGGSLDRPEMA